MPTREEIRDAIRTAYGARIQGDAEAAASAFTEDAVFELNAKGVDMPGWGESLHGREAIRQGIAALIQTFKVEEWQELLLIVEGDRAAHRWRAKITGAETGRSRTIEGVDIVEFRGGKIGSFHQSLDSAGFASLVN